MSPARSVRALRGATTVDEDSVEQVSARTHELLMAMMEDNGLVEEDLISVLFTATQDVVSAFPATVAREIGFGAVPLICAAEINVQGATTHCIRVLMHIETERSRADLHHVYQHGAQGLRDDLPS